MQRDAPLPGVLRVPLFLRLHRRSNDDSRVDSGSTSTNGITLFKKTAVILCEGDAIGAVILLNNKDGKYKMGPAEQKLASTAAGFLGRQMES